MRKYIAVYCYKCGTKFSKEEFRIKECIKNKWKWYCSKLCKDSARMNRILYKCFRDKCANTFYRTLGQNSKSKSYYCSLRCAALINNYKYPRDHGAIIKMCDYCSKKFTGREKYCNRKCNDLGRTIPVDVLLDEIKMFVDVNNRLPLKREFGHYSSIRRRFETWNKAISAAGFDPNPVLFAKKQIAMDGHVCDSLAERIIDDYLFRRNITHEIHPKYPKNEKYTADFKVGNLWIEFFGLTGEHKKYDQLRKIKLKIAKQLKLELIEIYPRDLFPKGRLNEIFRPYHII